MTYFPPTPPSTYAPFQCEGCGDWYVKNPGIQMSCLVNHAPGTCCHVNESLVCPTCHTHLTSLPCGVCAVHESAEKPPSPTESVVPETKDTP